MPFNLHISHNKSDWDTLNPKSWNKWQKLASITKGVVTPGNIVSCGGALLVIVGFVQLTEEITLSGLLLVAIGRLADAVDGYIADKTGTKSLVGEAIDSIMDKLVATIALIIIIAFGLLPIIVTIVIAAHTIANSLIAVIGKFRRIQMHPSLKGKLATFLIWLTILGYLLYEFMEHKNYADWLSIPVLLVSWLLFLLFVILGSASTLEYTKQVWGNYKKTS